VSDRPFTAFLIAGEESGDHLGARLIEAMKERLGDGVRFVGVGGERMEAHGLKSLFPMHEIAYHGVSAIIVNVHRIIAKMQRTARAVVKADPDVLVIIDCPGFSLGVARRVRKWKPSIPIVEYVSPTVWVWRPGRARWISGFVDRILAILPFEPEVHKRLGGPPCTYVGHPLIQRLRHWPMSSARRLSCCRAAAATKYDASRGRSARRLPGLSPPADRWTFSFRPCRGLPTKSGRALLDGRSSRPSSSARRRSAPLSAGRISRSPPPAP